MMLPRRVFRKLRFQMIADRLDHTALNQILAAHEMVVSFAGIATPMVTAHFTIPNPAEVRMACELN